MISFPLPPERAARLLVAARRRVLGGPGSGNFGHAGRPGEIGGSQTGDVDRWRQGDQEDQELNGVLMRPDPNPDFQAGINRELYEPPLEVPKGKHVSAGVVVVEPDGRVWVVEPKGNYGAYRNTFPKGTVDPGENLQETALREVWEETGLVAEVTGHLADVERTTSVARFYVGKRIGGAPWAAGKETHAVKLLPIHGKSTETRLKSVYGRKTSDQKVLDALRSYVGQRMLGGPGSGNFGHAGRPGEVGGSSSDVGSITDKQGQSYRVSKTQLTTKRFGQSIPGSIEYTVHSDVDLQASKTVDSVLVKTEIAKLTLHESGEFVKSVEVHTDLQRRGIATELYKLVETDLGYRLKRSGHQTPSGAAFSKSRVLGGPGSGNFGHAGRPGEVGGSSQGTFPEGLKKVGEAKGTNPGGTYVDKTGQKWYVKHYKNPDQAATEHVANEIYRRIGVDVPHSEISDDSKQIALEWEKSQGVLNQVGLDKENANAILDGFAGDVFLMNWDAVGTGHDNVIIKPDGSPMRVDQGGTLLYRAQGAPKPEALLHKIGEWDSLQTQNHYYAQVFKAAGVKNADALGDRVIKQIDKIVTARPDGGWKSLVDRKVPNASASFREKVGAMLEARQKALEEKRDQLKGKLKAAEERYLKYDPNQPRAPKGHPDGGKWTSEGGGGGDFVVKKKAPKAAPVSLEAKKSAYAAVKSGMTFKKAAAQFGMTQGQLAGYVFKTDQLKAQLEGQLDPDAALGNQLTPEQITQQAQEEIAVEEPPMSPDNALPTIQEQVEAEMFDSIAKGEEVYDKAAVKAELDKIGSLDDGEKSPTDKQAEFAKEIAAVKADPKSMSLGEKKAAAYDEIKAGKLTFKQAAEKYGMTPGQVSGYVYQTDQKAKKAAGETVEQKAAPATVPTGGFVQHGKIYTQSGDLVSEVPAAGFVMGGTIYDKNQNPIGFQKLTQDAPAPTGDFIYKKWGDLTDEEKKVAQWIPSGLGKDSPYSAAHGGGYKVPVGVAKPEPAAPSSKAQAVPAAAVKTWSAMTKDEQLTTAHNEGYQWKEKTYGPQAGKYAWFKDGVQVSAPLPGKGDYKEGMATINYGKGVVPTPPEPQMHHAQDWPVGDHVVRQMGSKYPTVVQEKAEPWLKGLTSSERSAIESYTGSAYGSWNDILRHGGEKTSSIKAMEKALDKAPTPPPPELVWRGISGSTKQFESLGVGDVIEMKGFQSTSLKPEFAHSWGSGKILFEIKPAAGGYVRSISHHSSEYEYILPHGKNYTVVGVAKVALGSAGSKHKVIQLQMHK